MSGVRENRRPSLRTYPSARSVNRLRRARRAVQPCRFGDLRKGHAGAPAVESPDYRQVSRQPLREFAALFVLRTHDRATTVGFRSPSGIAVPDGRPAVLTHPGLDADAQPGYITESVQT